MQAATDPAQPASVPQPPPSDEQALVSSVSHWLAARWLPAPPFTPDPAWQDAVDTLPDPPMSPATVAAVLGLLQARQACQDSMGLDPADPAQAARLARVVSTLNRRMDDLSPVLQATDLAGWQDVAALNDQVDTVTKALAAGLLKPTSPPDETPLAPWRPLLSKLKALAPLIAIVQSANLNPDDPQQLAELVRPLRKVTLPPLEQPMQVMQMIAHCSAIERLQKSLGADPSKVPLDRVRKAVLRKLAAVAADLPPGITMADGKLAGMPPTQPNPSQLINQPTIAAAQKINPAPMAWTTPSQDQLPLLTSGAPVASLVGLLQKLGQDPVQNKPCGGSCDAGAIKA